MQNPPIQNDAEVLKDLYKDCDPFHGKHHARYIRADVPYHVISRVCQGRHLLRPSKELNQLIAGVVGRAQWLYYDVSLYAIVVMSNHMHMQLQGPPRRVADFIGYIKREISYRWGGNPRIDWPGTMWEEYVCTALPTEESQVKCLEYILGHGVKEGLVAKAHLWPGVNSAAPLLRDGVIRGQWFDGTEYSRAVDRQSRAKHPKHVRKADYYRQSNIKLLPIPAWSGLDDQQRQTKVRAMLQRIEKDGKVKRAGRQPLGVKAIKQVPRDTRSKLPNVPWLVRHKKMVCWADLDDVQARQYLQSYWGFQTAYLEASTAFRMSQHTRKFPAGAFVPMWHEPPESLTAAA